MKYPNKATMIEDVKAEVLDWPLESLIGFVQDVIEQRLKKAPIAVVRERWRVTKDLEES